ncbi:MAG: glucose-1-phosphate cytidylyltransferase [Thaumarchaeota archaeon]|jgi:glucose-1-phosphate cytidylyltransferase|nr:MAG: glucose-1-phosphate cytidylyltransferase [Nitrososphaerota archaeon]
MKAIILAGGLGSRISEETKLKPKPMIEIGGKPILWHIMKRYSFYGINDFIICCGYKGDKIKEYFLENKESWDVSCIDTGLETMTGGRLKRIQKLVNDTFCFTYGDTLNDLNIKKLIEFHKEMKTLATVTACIPPEKYGVLEINQKKVTSFKEKMSRKDTWVNGGFFVLEPEIFDYIKNDSTIWEKEPLEKLAEINQLSAYQHHGFYQHMDTMKEKEFLNKLWNKGEAKWKIG